MSEMLLFQEIPHLNTISKNQYLFPGGSTIVGITQLADCCELKSEFLFLRVFTMNISIALTFFYPHLHATATNVDRLSDIRDHACTPCAHKFVRKSHLVNHVKQVHEGENIDLS